MAKGKYQKLYEARMKRLGKGSNTEDDLQRQLTNYKARMEAGGVENPEIDDRNALEKLLNLEQDQGLIRDVFEILNRPQQALFTGIKNSQEGGSFLEGMKEGITGNEETEFKDILMNTGNFEDEKGKLNLVDVLGFAGDVFLDPMNIPVGGFGKVGKALDAGDNIFKAMRNADTVDDLLFKGVGKVAKKGAKLADTNIEKGLKYLDETRGVKVYDKSGNLLSDAGKLKYHNADAKRASELMPELMDKTSFGKKVVNPSTGRLERYKQLKNDFSDMFQKSKASVDAIVAKRNANVTEDEIKIKIGKNLKGKEDKIKEYIGEGVTPKKLSNANEDITLFIESMMDRTLDKDTFLEYVRKGQMPVNETVIKNLEDMRAQLPEKLRVNLNFDIKVDDKGFVRLGSGWNKDVLEGNGISSFNELDKSNMLVDYGNWYEEKDLKRIEKLKKDERFINLIKDIFGDYKEGGIVEFDGDTVRFLDGAEAQAKHSQLMRDMSNQFLEKGIDESELYKHIKRTDVNGPTTEGGGYIRTSNSFSINDKVRDKLPLGKDAPTVDALNKGIANFELPEDTGLIRKENSEVVKLVFGLPKNLTKKETADALQSFVGKPIKWNDAFTSTAVGDGSFAFLRDTDMFIRAPKGTHMYVANPAEREAILGQAQEMMLRKVNYNEAVGRLELTWDIYGINGEKLATMSSDAVNDTLKMIDEGFGTSLHQKYPNEKVYFPHTLADETIFSAAEDINEPILKGKTSILNTRKRLGSMRENNNLYRKSLTGSGATTASKKFYKKYPKLFEENFTKAFSNKFYELTGLAKQHKIVNDVLIEQTFGNVKEISKIQKDIRELSLSKNPKDVEKLKELTKKYNSMVENSTVKYLTKFDNKVPNGFTVIEKDHATEIRKKLKNIQNSVGTPGDDYKKLMKLFENPKGKLAINTDVLRMLEVNLNEKKINSFVKSYDKWLNFFKTTKTLSPVNTLNNIVGNSSNLYLSGIDMTEQAVLMPKAVEIVKNGQDLYTRKIAGETLSKADSKIADIWEIFTRTGFGQDSIALDLQDVPDFMKEIALKGKSNKKIGTKEALEFLPKLNLKTGIFMDNVSRITVLLKAMDDPGYIARLGIKGVDDIDSYRQVISKVMFDPSMMTDVERNVMKRIIPFYTYAKNNLVFQIDNLGRNGSRYARTLKGFEHLQKAATDNNEENMSDYIKDSLYIPIPSLDENGNYTILRTSLPFGQLIETVDDPIKQFANMTGPLGKGAYEYSTGIDSFTGREIERFPGEKSTQLPFMTKKTQKLLGDLTGLDVPLKNAYKLYEGVTSPEYGPLEGLGRGALNTVTMQGNIDTDRIHKQYEELDELQNLMKQYEQQGYEFSTMTELKKANKNNTVAGIDAIFAKYGIDEKTYAERKYGQ